MTDMYQTPGDRLRFEILLKSLTEGSLNLAVLSDHDQVLDFYGTLFEERLRAKGETQIEFCASTNSEQLVQKFNEILSELTLNQALEKEAKHAPRRYLVFRDSILMQDFELQLLARLVNGFPAGNISVILLLKRSGSFRNKLDAFGKNLLQWEVEAKVGEVKEPLKDWVADTPDPSPEALAAQLLKSSTKPSWRVPGADKPAQEPVLLTQAQPSTSSEATAKGTTPSASTAAPVTESVSAVSHDVTALPDFSREPVLSAFSDPDPVDAPPVFEREARSVPWGWMLLVALLSLLAFAFMYRDLVMTEVELMKKYLLRGTPAAAVPADSASAAKWPASAPAWPMASQASEPAVAASAVAETASAPVPAATTPPTAAASTPPLSASAAVAATVKAPVSADKAVAPASEAKPVAAATKAVAKASEDNSDTAWLKQLPSTGYVVQLAAFDTEEEVNNFKRSNKLYEEARILSPRKKGTTRRYFILVAGPFENKVDADAYMRTNPLLAKAWLRTSQSILSQFDRP